MLIDAVIDPKRGLARALDALQPAFALATRVYRDRIEAGLAGRMGKHHDSPTNHCTLSLCTPPSSLYVNDRAGACR